MALYTGKGDAGTTKLFDSKSGERVSKSAPIFDALGTLDECNSVVGLCKALSLKGALVCSGVVCSDILHQVQDHLFTIQAEVAGAEKRITPEGMEVLERTIAAVEAELPEIRSFFIPGSSELSAYFDLARTVARRAERSVVSLHESKAREMSKESLAYLNRLSSLLYALARYVAHTQGVAEQAPTYSV
jgi:cob(I)alamin adenosyltransferase